MPTLQQQAPHLAGAYSLRGEAAIPGTCGDEHCGTDVYRPVGGVGAVMTIDLSIRFIRVWSSICGVVTWDLLYEVLTVLIMS